MTSNRILISNLQKRLSIRATKKTKVWFENYLKGAVSFRGLYLAQVRDELNGWYLREKIGDLSENQQLLLALQLFPEKYAEDKLAGILFIQLHLRDKVP